MVLIVVLTFFFLKDGAKLWEWALELFHEDRQPMLREVGARSWAALSAFVQGVVLVATIDAVLIGAALLILGVPVAIPLIVLTFVAAFFPIVGAFAAGAAAVLVASWLMGSAPRSSCLRSSSASSSSRGTSSIRSWSGASSRCTPSASCSR